MNKYEKALKIIYSWREQTALITFCDFGTPMLTLGSVREFYNRFDKTLYWEARVPMIGGESASIGFFATKKKAKAAIIKHLAEEIANAVEGAYYDT